MPGAEGDARIEAGSAIYDTSTGSYRLEGGVVITRGLVRLRANSVRYDPSTKAVEAAGGVLLTDATRVLAAEGLHAVLGGDFEATGVVVFLKTGPVDLAGAANPSAAATCGTNAMAARAERVDGTAGKEGGPLRLSEARLTLCDCPAEGAPSWELRTASALVIPGERVELTWPVLYVTPRFLMVDHPVPIFAFPWLALPLGERVSGLLATELGSTGVTGVTIGQPVFITLGPTADLTATPRYYFGRSREKVAAGEASVRGPSASLEARWTPAPDVAGRLQADVTWDLDDGVGPEASDGAAGLRLGLTGGWAQRLSPATTLRADLDLVSDGLYVRDFTPDVLQRDATSRRSAVQLSTRRDDLVLEATAAWLEPVARDDSLGAVPSGIFGARLPAFQRWPAAAALLLPTPVAGPLRLSGRAGLARFAPPSGFTSDGGADGVGAGDRGWTRASSDPASPYYDPTELDGRWDPGERRAITRLDARAEVAAPFLLGDLLSVEPSLRGVVQGTVVDQGGDPAAAGWGVARIAAGTTLTRRYGALRHLVAPRVEWSLTSAMAGGRTDTYAADGLDRGPSTPAGVSLPACPAEPSSTACFGGQRLAAAAPPGVSHQLRLAVGTSLSREGKTLLRGEVGQEFDLRRGSFGEAWLTGEGTGGPLSVLADLRAWTGGTPAGYPAALESSWLDTFSELRLQATVASPRGHALRAGLLAVGPGGSGRLGAGRDVLFDPRPAPVNALAPATQGSTGSGEPAIRTGGLASSTLGATLQLGPAALRYDVLFPGRTALVAACSGDGLRQVGAWEVQQHAASVEWDSPCRCFKARVAIRVDGCGDLGASFALDLGQAGSPAR